MSNFLTQVRKWLGLDKPEAQHVPEEDLRRAEGEGMPPPEMQTPSPRVDELPEDPMRSSP
jgi:hypothetical protein